MILCWTIAPTNVGNALKKKKLYVLEHYCDQNQSYSAYNNNTENKSVFINIFVLFDIQENITITGLYWDKQGAHQTILCGCLTKDLGCSRVLYQGSRLVTKKIKFCKLCPLGSKPLTGPTGVDVCVGTLKLPSNCFGTTISRNVVQHFAKTRSNMLRVVIWIKSNVS